MKMSIQTLRIVAGLGLAAGMMIGCQNFLNPDNSSATGTASADQAGALSLSIKDDSACRGEWHAILDARTAGHPDSASEAAFLSSCVTEIKPDKDKPKPVIPPALLPDSCTRCKWIVAQIEGGRDSLTVSYKKYCPEDCRKLEAADSASHEKLCREPGPGPRPRPDDSGVVPPKPLPGDDTCKRLHDSLEIVKPGQPGRADLEHLFAARCKEPIPHDTAMIPPKPFPGDDTCKMLADQLAILKEGDPARAVAARNFALRCKEPIPHDTTIVPPGPDSLPPKPPEHDSICMDLKLRLGATVPGTAEHQALEAAFKAECMEPVPVTPPVVLPPKDSLPPIQPPTVTVNCDELRQKLAVMDTTTADYARLLGSLKEHCPVK